VAARPGDEALSRRASTRLAWGLAGFALVLIVSATVVSATSGDGGVHTGFFIWAITLVFAAVGILIASREPRNAIGWLFLGAAVGAGLGGLAGSYADYWVDARTGPALLGKTAAWYGNLSWMPFILVPVTFLLLLFPDGHLLSRRWRPVAWCAGLGIAVNFVAEGLHAGRISDYPQIRNPYGVDSVAVDALQGLAALTLFVAIAGSSLSLVLRFRRARGEQREQLKWLAFAGAVAALTLVVAVLTWDQIGETAANVSIMVSVLGLPIATAIAILRYRLYDIDLVINRTLVYGALTATLAAVYLVSVLVLQLVLTGLTRGSGLAVAVSTLAAAAVFRPARARIQDAVDRRFFRRKYDARRTLEDFSVQLRNEVDLAALNAELRAVVGETLQPAHVSLWLRSPEARA
jgi:hypothetical protein